MRTRVPLYLFVVVLAAVACKDSGPARTEVRIDGLVVRAELATTVEERAQGLSGRGSLPEDGGMLFVFPEEQRPAFWMRDMRFPLDFIWISRDYRVAALTENVPPPDAGLAPEDLPRYRPDVPVRYVLEVNAGIVREYGVQAGDAVTFDPDVLVEATP